VSCVQPSRVALSKLKCTDSSSSGTSSSITITSDKERLADKDRDRMSQEATEYALRNEALRDHALALNELQLHVSLFYSIIAVYDNFLGSQLAKARSDFGVKCSTDSVELCELLDAHTLWAESSGRFASIGDLNQRLSEVKTAVDTSQLSDSRPEEGEGAIALQGEDNSLMLRVAALPPAQDGSDDRVAVAVIGNISEQDVSELVPLAVVREDL
jgi:hypothetical protein